MLGALAVSTAWCSEATWEYAVQLSAVAESSPAKVTLNWVQDSQSIPSTYLVSRKAPNASSWTSLATLPGATTSYVDSNVSVGSGYEYQVQKVASTYNGFGYVT